MERSGAPHQRVKSNIYKTLTMNLSSKNEQSVVQSVVILDKFIGAWVSSKFRQKVLDFGATFEAGPCDWKFQIKV